MFQGIYQGTKSGRNRLFGSHTALVANQLMDKQGPANLRACHEWPPDLQIKIRKTPPKITTQIL